MLVGKRWTFRTWKANLRNSIAWTRSGSSWPSTSWAIRPIHLYVGPTAVNYGQRQMYRRALRLLLDLDSVIDAYRAEDDRSEKGSDKIQELLDSIRAGHKETGNATAQTLRREFLSVFDDGRTRRYSAEWTNTTGDSCRYSNVRKKATYLDLHSLKCVVKKWIWKKTSMVYGRWYHKLMWCHKFIAYQFRVM